MKIKLIYSTQTGATKYMAELLQKRFVDRHHHLDLHDVGVDGFKPKITGYDLLLFGAPTYYGGQLERTMADLIADFETDLSRYHVAIFSLGDSGYGHFCGSAEILESWVKKNSGKLIISTLKVDGYPKNFTQFTQWVTDILAKIKS